MLHAFVMPPTGFSSLASTFHDRIHEVPNRTSAIFGIAIHQTGESIVTEALQHETPPLEYAAEFYLNPSNYFAHYVVGHNGEILQIAGEQEKALHIGFKSSDRACYLDGSWADKLPADLVKLWADRWPNFKSPAHLFPGPSPNDVYVGIEMLPVVDGCGAQPASWLAAGRFTKEQHEAVVDLALDIAERNSLPAGWHLANRLLGHEDVNPIERSTKKPPAGWDPGSLRDQPWFDFAWVRTMIHNKLNPLPTL